MSGAPVHLAGERLMLDPGGAVFWPAQSLLAVADLHLEKGTAAALRGQLVPPFDTRATLDILAGLLRRYRPRIVVALGDSFHDSKGAERLQPGDSQRLSAMMASTRFVWVLGNHDPAPQLPGEATESFRLGPLTFRHQAAGPAEADISGHFHPKTTVAVKGANVSRPCFVFDSRRLLLPAIGAYTGGLDVGAPPIAALFPRGGRVFLLGRERLFSFPMAARRAAPAAPRESPPLMRFGGGERP